MSAELDVLVVDDEPVVCDAIRLVLGHEGLSVASVPDAEAALDHPALGGCRLVICDLMLPGRSGLEMLRAIRKRRPALPVLMITGFATPATADLVLAAGATAFLPKPFDESELLTLVRHVLAPMDAAGEERSP
jgi:DNA-binding NtrC family response regulator